MRVGEYGATDINQFIEIVLDEINFSNTNVLKESLLNFFFPQKIMFLIHYQAIKIFLKSKKFFFKPDKKIDTFSYYG